MVKMWSLNRNPRVHEEKLRSDLIDDIVELEGNDKLRVIPMHRFTLVELRFMKTEQIANYKVMLKRLWEQQNPTA